MQLRNSMVLVLVAVLVQTSAGGSWPRKAGSGYLQLGFSTIGYDKVYDDAAVKVPAPGTARDNVLQLYAEYGLTSEITLGVAIPFGFISVKDYFAVLPPLSSQAVAAPQDISTSGLGDLTLSAQLSVLRWGGSVLSAGVLFGLPTGDTTDTDGLWLGDGEFNVAPRLLYGLSLSPLPAYLSADLGYNIRGAGYSDEVFGNLEAGYAFLQNRLWAIVRLSVQKSTRQEPSREIPAARLGLYNNNREFVAITPKLLYKLGGGLGLVVSYATATSGRNVAGGAVVAGSVFYEF